jgi:hypothetical protein
MIHKINCMAGRSVLVKQSKLNLAMVAMEFNFRGGGFDTCASMTPHEAMALSQALAIEAEKAEVAAIALDLAELSKTQVITIQVLDKKWIHEAAVSA